MLRMTPLKQGFIGAAVVFAAMWLYIDWRTDIGPDQITPTFAKCGQVAIFFFVIFWVLGHLSKRFMIALNPFGTRNTPPPTLRDIISAIHAIIHQDKKS